MTTIENQIRSAAKDLLQNGTVSCVIGYEIDTRGRERPAFITRPEDVDRLTWNPKCNLNLVSYLNDRKLPPAKDKPVPVSAVVARPCDVRSLNLLINEKQVKRENVKVIGITCPGCEINGKQRSMCSLCKERIPVFYDVLIEPESPISAPDTPQDWSDIAEMDQWTPAKRLAYWQEQFDRCIRCYACRQACPACYCFECVSEQVDPHWSSIAINIPEKMFFHVMRAYHLAGRCVGCGACDAACPMDIPLEKLNRKVAKEILDLFGYQTGDDPVIHPPLTCFDPNEHMKI